MRFTMTTIALLVAIAVPAANADMYFSPASGTGEWDVASNWSTGSCGGTAAGRIPLETDRVVICVDKVCQVDANAVADTLVVEGGATLEIFAGISLTLDNDSDADHTVNGTIKILYDGSTAGGLLLFDDSSTRTHEIFGSGIIDLYGYDPDDGQSARFEIASGDRVELDGPFLIGSGRLRGAGTFQNNSKVRASGASGGTVSGILLVEVTGRLEDTAGERWEASTAAGITATLQFSSAIVNVGPDAGDGHLNSDFVIKPGAANSVAKIINDESGLTSNGRLLMTVTAGTARLETNQSLTFEADIDLDKMSISAGSEIYAPALFKHLD